MDYLIDPFLLAFHSRFNMAVDLIAKLMMGKTTMAVNNITHIDENDVWYEYNDRKYDGVQWRMKKDKERNSRG